MLDTEAQRKARQRASELGVSLAAYVRFLIDRDLGARESFPDPRAIFDLGRSADSDIADRKDEMIAEALAVRQKRVR